MKNWRRSPGMLAGSFGDTWAESQWRIQVYWPEVVVRTTEFHVMLRTTVRLLWRYDGRGCGFQVLGFGFGIAWYPPGKVVKEKLA